MTDARRTRFAFDLDGTVTMVEILPLLARELGLRAEMAELTRRTMDGEIDFVQSFTRRFSMLRAVPVARVREITAAVPLDPDIEKFITANADRCAIVTGNLDIWIEPLIARLKCPAYCSVAAKGPDGPVLSSILDKERAVRDMAASGDRIVATGDGANDIPMFRAADVSVAYGGVREPSDMVKAEADRVLRDGPSLCAFLSRF